MAYAKQQRKKGTLTKDEIVQCAFNLIANKGTEGCSMRALGNELGVSAMALYGYIPSRENLLNEVVERFLKTVDIPRAARRALGRHAHSHNPLATSILRFFPAFRRAPCATHASDLASSPTCSSCALSILAKECQKISPCSSSPSPTRTLRASHCAPAKTCASSKPKRRASRQRPMRALCDDIARPRHAHRQSEPRRRTTALQRALAPNRRRRLFRDLVPKGPTRNY